MPELSFKLTEVGVLGEGGKYGERNGPIYHCLAEGQFACACDHGLAAVGGPGGDPACKSKGDKLRAPARAAR